MRKLLDLSIIIGGLIALACFLANLFDGNYVDAHPGFSNIGQTAFVVALCAYFIRRFFFRMQTPVTPSQNAPSALDKSANTIGRLSLAVAVGFGALLLFLALGFAVASAFLH